MRKLKSRPELLCPKIPIRFCRIRPSLQSTLPETTKSVSDNVIKKSIVWYDHNCKCRSMVVFMLIIFCFQSLQHFCQNIFDHIKKGPQLFYEILSFSIECFTGSSVASFCFFATYARNSGKSIEPLSLESSLKWNNMENCL